MNAVNAASALRNAGPSPISMSVCDGIVLPARLIVHSVTGHASVTVFHGRWLGSRSNNAFATASACARSTPSTCCGSPRSRSASGCPGIDRSRNWCAEYRQARGLSGRDGSLTVTYA